MPKSSQQIQVFFSSEHLLYSCGSALPPIRGKNGLAAGGRGSVFNFAQNPVNFSLENIPLLQKLYREELVGQTFEASGCVRPRRLLDKWSSGGARAIFRRPPPAFVISTLSQEEQQFANHLYP